MTSSTAVAQLIFLKHVASGPVTPLGVAALPDKPVYLARPESEAWDWIVLRLSDDPVFRSGELAIPRPVRKRLTELERRGAHFDELLIAHEVPRGSDVALSGTPGWEANLLTSLSKARVQCSVDRIDRVFGMITNNTSKIVADFAAVASGIGSDPVLIGAVRIDDDTDPRYAWFVLAARDL